MATKKLCAVADCGKPFYCRGYCVAHYQRVMAYGDPLATAINPRKSFLEMALRYEGDGCLLWPYKTNPQGYVSIRYDGRKETAHRIICRQVNGESPDPKMEVRHLCGVRACVAPKHLVWGTHKENMNDKVEHGTAPRGANNGHTKLTEADVRWIREFGTNMPRKAVAKMFGVSRHAIGRVVLRRDWNWLE